MLGIYKATVVRNNDPTGAQRLILAIPQILGRAASEWADPSAPTSIVPNLGDVVWVQFSGGDITKPVYVANGLRELGDTLEQSKHKVTFSDDPPPDGLTEGFTEGDVW